MLLFYKIYRDIKYYLKCISLLNCMSLLNCTPMLYFNFMMYILDLIVILLQIKRKYISLHGQGKSDLVFY